MPRLPRFTLFRLAIAWGAAAAVLGLLALRDIPPARCGFWGGVAALTAAAIPMLDRSAAHALIAVAIVLACSVLGVFWVDACTGIGIVMCLILALGMLRGVRLVGFREDIDPRFPKKPGATPERGSGRESLEFF